MNWNGVCAADHLPFGTKVTLPDGRVLIVADRFGGGFKDRLDIFLETEAECRQFGRQWLKCLIEAPDLKARVIKEIR